MLKFSTRRFVVLTCTAVAALLACGCSSVQTYPITHTANFQNSTGREFTRVAEGQTLTVSLPREKGMEHGWRLDTESYKNGKLTLISRMEARGADGGLAGIGEQAMDVFQFSADDTGTTTLVFVTEQLVDQGQPQLVGMWLDVNVFNARAEARAAEQARKAAEEAAEAEAEAFAAAQSEWE